jgi:Shedu protein SduA, C-terminal
VVTAAQAGRYLSAYVSQYRSQYAHITAPPPEGGGYPALPISPYLDDGTLNCYLARDGAVVLDTSNEPPQDPQSTVVTTMVVFPQGPPSQITQGTLGQPIERCDVKAESLHVEILRYKYTLNELVQRLTFGGSDITLDLNQMPIKSQFWLPVIIRNIRFMPAGGPASRFFRYCEILRHVDKTAWDERSTWARAHHDIRRDFVNAVGSRLGGVISLQGGPGLPNVFYGYFHALQVAADGLESLLTTSPNAPESTFHDYLRSHSVLLDVYGKAESKPRLEYPQGESPLGKKYVEPDFIISYWNRTYKLVELERPDHPIATKSGDPRAAVNHAAFQIAEWKDYINNHYEVIKSRYPGISGNYTSLIVIGRETQQSFRNIFGHRYLAILGQQFAVDEVFTYDDVVNKARAALQQLNSLRDAMIGYSPDPGTHPAGTARGATGPTGPSAPAK